MKDISDKKIFIILLLLVFILLMPSFFSCEYLFDKFIPKKEAAFAKEYLIRLKSRDFDHIKRYLSPKLSAEVNDTKIEEVASYFPSGELINAIIIGSQVTKSAEQWQANLFYEFQFSDGWAIANVVLEKVGQQLQINHLYINQTIDSQKKLNSFRLHNRSPKHFFVLFLSLLVPLFILVTLYFCIKTPIPKRKWLWILFVSFGIGTIALNWTTGQSWFKLTSGQLLGAGWWADSPYSSWIIKVSIPLGAIIYWIKRKKFFEIASFSIKKTHSNHWYCPECNKKNNEAILKCPCGYKLESKAYEELIVHELSDVDRKNSEPQAIEMLRSTGVQLMVSPFGRTCAVLLMVGGIGGIGKIVFAGLQEFSGNIVPMAIFLSCGIVGYALWVGKKWSVFIARILFGLQIPIINSDLFRYNFFQERVLIFYGNRTGGILALHLVWNFSYFSIL